MNKQILMGALPLLVALGAFSLTGCGGGDDDSGSPFSGGDDSRATSESTQPAGDNGDDSSDSGGFGFGTGTAKVTIGDKTYEFDLTSGFVVCQNVFDAIQVSGPAKDDDNVTLDMWIPPTNWDTYDDNRYDPPRVEVTDDSTNEDWVADPNSSYQIDAGKSQVDSYEKDGLTASGSATFVDAYLTFTGGDPQPVQGSFEVSCAE